MTKHIAITGEGIICSIGNDKTSVAYSLANERSGIGVMHFLQSAHHELPVGEVKLSNDFRPARDSSSSSSWYPC